MTVSGLIEVCDPTDFRTLATIRASSMDAAKLYAHYGHVVLYEKAGERRLIGYVDAGPAGVPYLYREEVTA